MSSAVRCHCPMSREAASLVLGHAYPDPRSVLDAVSRKQREVLMVRRRGANRSEWTLGVLGHGLDLPSVGSWCVTCRLRRPPHLPILLVRQGRGRRECRTPCPPVRRGRTESDRTAAAPQPAPPCPVVLSDAVAVVCREKFWGGYQRPRIGRTSSRPTPRRFDPVAAGHVPLVSCRQAGQPGLGRRPAGYGRFAGRAGVRTKTHHPHRWWLAREARAIGEGS